jgi:hypothetical protein
MLKRSHADLDGQVRTFRGFSRCRLAPVNDKDMSISMSFRTDLEVTFGVNGSLESLDKGEANTYMFFF